MAAAQNWTLVWSDEFNGPAGSAPSGADWNFMHGKNPANGELEFYCPPGDNGAPCSAANPNVFEDGNGNLVIRAIRTPSGTWTSGRMNTQGKHQFQYGRIEARMKLVPGAGFWPAFWMLGTNIGSVGWPTCGEQDIMEWVPKYTPTTTSSTDHGPGYSGGNGIGMRFTFPNGGRIDDAGYHTYGVIWSQNQLEYYRDDPTKPFFINTPARIPAGTQWVYNHPFFILMNFAVGGGFPGAPNASSPSPADVLVDYVRVYVPGSGGPPTAPTLATPTAGNNQVSLSWSSSAGASTYNVKRTLTSGMNYALVASGLTATSFTDTTVTNGTTYFYVVSAQNTAGESPNSNQVSATPTSGPPPPTGVAINAGGAAVGTFTADKDFTGGTTINHANTIDISKVTNPAPAAVYQTARIGNFSYTIPGFVAGSSHTVRLHFAETFFGTAGSRTFNVKINGTQVLTGFDIFKAAGGKNIANIQQFTGSANASGQIVITFTSVVNNSLISGIEVQ
ncbi:MAG TPA: malectin domain-containing carbohydrate-binding protein [Terriglobales bacterium]|nr:malectin domain-containing carbohydrate-binding protein [Terriglobales bacterium]